MEFAGKGMITIPVYTERQRVLGLQTELKSLGCQSLPTGSLTDGRAP